MEVRRNLQKLFITLSIRMEGTTYVVPVPILVVFLLFIVGESGHAGLILAEAAAASAFVFLLGLITRRASMKPFLEAIRLIDQGKSDAELFSRAKSALLERPAREAFSCVIRWMTAVTMVGLIHTLALGSAKPEFLFALGIIGLFNGLVSVPLFFFGTELDCAPALETRQFREAGGALRWRISLRLRLTYTILAIVLYLTGMLSLLIVYLNKGFIEQSRTLTCLAILALGSILLVAIITRFFARSIGEPVAAIDAALRTMNENKGDLTARVAVTSGDDIGALSESFNSFLAFLAGSMRELSAAADSGRELGSSLSATSEETSEAAREISKTMGAMSEKTDRLRAETRGSREASEAISRAVAQAVELIESQASAVNESSAAVVQTLANIASLERTAADKQVLVDRLKSSGLEGQESMAASIALIKGISESTNVIMELIAVINGISRQTNLLAMNAAIEAAHAGDAGRGFSVVADEIRQLAESSGTNAKRISSSLREIIAKIANTARLTAETGKIIDGTLVGVDEVSSSLSEMLAGLKEMAIGSSQITQALTELNEMTEKLRESGRGMGEGAVLIGKSVGTVLALSEENASGIAEVKAGIGEIGGAMASLAELSSKNADSISLIDRELAKFKT